LEKPLVLTLERLSEEPYASILCYPKASKAEVKKRLKELRNLGITALEFTGEKQAMNVPVLGKGCVGIVVLTCRELDKVALKIRRVDADRAKMQREAGMLEEANSVQVGPRLLGVSRNFLLMQFVEGDLLPDWLDRIKGKARVRKVLRDVLEQCWRLDSVGLDHGELSHAPKHVIVNRRDKPFVVDFESASLNRKPANVTSICQFLFIASETAKRVIAKLGMTDGKAVVEALRCYKNDRTRGNFEQLLTVCGL
jgi:putative serine/threonine protein kinase